MTDTSATATSAGRKEIEDEMERISTELRELAETNKVLSKKLQTLPLEKPVENTLQIYPVCSCERKSDAHCQALKYRILVLEENEKGRQQKIKLLHRTFNDLIIKFDNLVLRAKSHAQGPDELKDTKTGIFSVADSCGNGLLASCSPSKGQTIVDTSQVKVKTYSKNSAIKNSLNPDTAPNITCYGDDSDDEDDSVDEDGNAIGYQKPKILSKANENKTAGLTLQKHNFGPHKSQGKSTQGREALQADAAKDQCPELIPKQTLTRLLPGIPASYWAELAKAETAAAPKEKVGKISTVLCLDISSSMTESRAWYQATTFIRHFIAGMEHSLQETNIDEESVALCVFGHEVKIVQRLTNHFSLITNALDCLKVGGPSPLLGGLLMSFAGLMDHTSCQANDIKIFARIILISDGKISSSEILAGPDSTGENKKEEESSVLEVVRNIREKEVRLHCVPVGNANQTFLEELATFSRGTVYPYTAGRKVAKKLANTLHAGAVLKHLKDLHSLPESRDFDEKGSFAEIIRSSNFMARMIIEGFLAAVCNSEEEREEVFAIAKEAVKEGLFENEDSHNNYQKYHVERLAANLPPLGSRVRRGPDWDKGNQDGNGPGTVVGHILDHRSVYVTWDYDNAVGDYRYGEGGGYDILVVDEPRVLKEDEIIQVGCLVKRGPDWRYGDQDGGPGAKGVVLRVLEDGQVIIRWPNRSKAYYRFGADGCFDLEICTPKFGGQGHTLRDHASASNTTASRFSSQDFVTPGGFSSASGNHSSQKRDNRNKNLTNKTSKVRTLFS